MGEIHDMIGGGRRLSWTDTGDERMSAAAAQAASVRMFAVEQAARTVATIVAAPNAAQITWAEIGEHTCKLASVLEQHITTPSPVVGPEIIPALRLAVQAIDSDGDGSIRQGLLDIVTKLKGDRDE